MFGTDGVRGIFNKELGVVEVSKLCMAIGTYLKPGARVLVASDYRGGTEAIYYAGVAGLISTGVKVYDAGKVPTPALQLAVREMDFDAGVMFTASHNPPEYVGVKLVGSDGVEVGDNIEEEVEAIYYESRFRRANYVEASHMLRRVDGVSDLYVDSISSLVDSHRISSKGYKVVVDAANSVTAYTSPRILRRLGVKVIAINADPSPIPSRPYEPTPDTLTDLSRTVRSVEADLGVGHDSDGDRAIFASEDGTIHWGDRSASIVAIHLAETGRYRGDRKVITAVSTSEYVAEHLKKAGIGVLYTAVGIKRLVEGLRRSGGICAFEENGGFVYPLFQSVRDGGAKLALFLEAMAYWNKRASELFSMFPRVYIMKTKIPMDRGRALKAVEAVKQSYKGFEIIDVDGVRVITRNGWFLVRPSGTEPVLRIMIESLREEEGRRLLDEVISIVRGADA
ncbi:MAG: phosphoglucosamine mutase [Desulfurococcales archaeon]|jgi:phosphomannomutase/phosphoglucomutase|nr:phosphoglucosamine mutase [Desulfurococcales archaeon]